MIIAMATRKLDELGRVRIPSKFFRILKMEEREECEITIEYGRICIKKFNPGNVMSNAHTGIVRRIDNLNRLTIPKEYIKVLKVPSFSKLNLMIDGDKIITSLA